MVPAKKELDASLGAGGLRALAWQRHVHPDLCQDGWCLALTRVFGELFFLMLLLAPCVSLAILLAPETPNPECMQCRREDLLEQKTICAGMMAVVGCRGTGAQECEKPLASSARVAQLLGLTFAPPGRGSCAACFFLWC